jgi:hypothetical protein
VGFHDPVQRVFAVDKGVELTVVDQCGQEFKFRCRHLADWSRMLRHIEAPAGRCGQTSRQNRRQFCHGIEDHIESFRAGFKFVGRLVDGLAGAQTSYQVKIPRAAYARDLGTEISGQLHGVHAHTARSAVNQHAASGADIRLSEHGQGRESARGKTGGRLRKAHGSWFVHHKTLAAIPGVFGQTDVFRTSILRFGLGIPI